MAADTPRLMAGLAACAAWALGWPPGRAPAGVVATRQAWQWPALLRLGRLRCAARWLARRQLAREEPSASARWGFRCRPRLKPLAESSSCLHWPPPDTVYWQVSSIWMFPTDLVRDILSSGPRTDPVWKFIAQKQ